MKTLAILNNHGFTKSSDFEIDKPVKEFDPSITDPTFYTPVGSMIRKLNSQDKVSMQINSNLYDFPDGKDNGMTIPLARHKGVDLAELSEAVASGRKKATKRLQEEAEKQKEKAVQEFTNPDHNVDPASVAE